MFLKSYKKGYYDDPHTVAAYSYESEYGCEVHVFCINVMILKIYDAQNNMRNNIPYTYIMLLFTVLHLREVLLFSAIFNK